MPAKQCPTCGYAWPAKKDYGTCPYCLIDTDYQSAVSAMTEKEAERRVAHVKFDRYYATWDAKRERRGDPSPEAIGALEAKEIHALERLMRASDA